MNTEMVQGRGREQSGMEDGEKWDVRLSSFLLDQPKKGIMSI